MLLASCSSDHEIEQVTDVTESKDPLNFTCQLDEQASGTRAGAVQYLTTGFMVSTYKAFAQPKQQTVMDKYKVEYKTSGTAWDGNVRPYWDYTGVPGQHERFWDYSNYPYRFNVIAPCPSAPASFVLNDKQLSIPARFEMQSCENGMVTPADAEPYMVAQVQRETTGKDYDLMSTKQEHAEKEINSSSSTLNRYVALPFHHLNSKIRFGVYGINPWLTSNPVYIQDLTINVSSVNFVTQANGYNAVGDEGEYSWYRGAYNSGFTGISSSTGTGFQLFKFTGGASVDGNDMSHHQGISSAYWLQCQKGIMQIPQENVTMTVSFKLLYCSDHKLYKEYKDVPIKLEDDSHKFNWKSGYIYTYYLIVGGVRENLEISFTATLAPWEDISGSLSTDLEQ